MAQAPKKETVYEEILMQDGRTVKFPGEQRVLSEKIESENGTPQGVRFDFRSGQTLLVDLEHGGLLRHFAAHGITQKYRDEIAGGKDQTVEDLYEDMLELHQRLEQGNWNERREGSGLAGTSMLVRALAEVKFGEVNDDSLTKTREFLKDKDQKVKLALRQVAPVKAVIERLEAEKLAKTPDSKKIDAEALLASF